MLVHDNILSEYKRDDMCMKYTSMDMSNYGRPAKSNYMSNKSGRHAMLHHFMKS